MATVHVYKCTLCWCQRKLVHFGSLEGTSTNWMNETVCTDCKAGRPVGLIWCIIGQHERPREDFVFPSESCYICVEGASPGRLRDDHTKRSKSLFYAIPEQESITWSMQVDAIQNLPRKVPSVRTKLFFDDIPLIPLTKGMNAQLEMEPLPQTPNAQQCLVRCSFGHHFKQAVDFDIGKKICKNCSQKRRRSGNDGDAIQGILCTYGNHYKRACDFDDGRRSCRQCLAFLAAQRRARTTPRHGGGLSTQASIELTNPSIGDLADPLDESALTSDERSLLLIFCKALKKD
jgi:hypothetical protein